MSKTIKEIEKWDRVNFDYSGYINGKKFNGGTAKGYTLIIGSGQFIPGFEEQMIGLKINEEKNIVVFFPNDYHARKLAGKETTFKIFVNSIKKPK